jgi:hypothetical protein
MDYRVINDSGGRMKLRGPVDSRIDRPLITLHPRRIPALEGIRMMMSPIAKVFDIDCHNTPAGKPARTA